MPCPMHEEPLHLDPAASGGAKVFAELCPPESGYAIPDTGDLCPSCRYIFNELLTEYDGDWAQRAPARRVRRLILSEKDRIGIGTFQPKDEKNQDSHRADRRHQLPQDRRVRLATRDPRAFNFDGEFNIANRGIIEFIEVLKLDVAFLYDLLGATPGAQDQAEEVRPDRHRRGDHRPHQRAGVQEAAEQRVHGGAPRPHREDRHPVHHPARRRDQDLREGLQQPTRSAASTSPRTRSRWRPCGRC